MAFQYKLETLLQIRRTVEEQAQQHLAQEIVTLENHKRILDEIDSSRKTFVVTLEEKKKRPLNAALYQLYADLIQGQDRQRAFQLNTIQAQQQLVESARADLEQKTQQRKIVERMREKAYLEYVDGIIKKEQKEFDELAVLRYRR